MDLELYAEQLLRQARFLRTSAQKLRQDAETLRVISSAQELRESSVDDETLERTLSQESMTLLDVLKAESELLRLKIEEVLK